MLRLMEWVSIGLVVLGSVGLLAVGAVMVFTGVLWMGIRLLALGFVGSWCSSEMVRITLRG
ncbi:membrane protein [Arthrobacter phage Mimi]|nr:hypothetical protein PBI_MIMI_64 [Arthrobacter phage Mimi]